MIRVLEIAEVIDIRVQEKRELTVPLRDRLSGDSLKRAPKGFDPDHPLIEDLRRKDHVAMKELTHKDILHKDFLKAYVGHCKRFSGYVQFLCKALDQPF